uniref:G-protein coupled receptors family 1 profile domain-containing protein n=1 Tax=Ditylenchus dipsaci TaxID=166011 RepID=A0A915D9D2_9BILA
MSDIGFGDLDNDQGPTWIADLVFQRHNISVKYVADGNILILAEMARWEDIQPRLMKNLGWMLMFVLSIVLNFILLLISLSKARQLYHKKVKCLVANLAFCNIILSLGSLIYTFLVDVYYDVDSFETLIRLNEGIEFAPLWPFAKQIVHSEMFMMGVDRYLSLFDGYSPSVKRPFWFCALSVVPYFFALLVFDYRIMVTQVNGTVAHLIRLVALIAPILLSVVFTGCSVVRLYRNKEESDQLLSDVLHCYYQIAHLLFLTSPLYMALIIQLFVAYYRNGIWLTGRRVFGCMTKCNKDPKLDYSSETMRSIIAEQTRARQLRTCYVAR